MFSVTPSSPRVIIDKDLTTVVNVRKVGIDGAPHATSALPPIADMCGATRDVC
jgi:hypothetical protein